MAGRAGGTVAEAAGAATWCGGRVDGWDTMRLVSRLVATEQVAQEYGPEGHPTVRSDSVGWREALPRLLAIFLVSRLLVLLVAGSLLAIPVGHDPDTWTDRPILAALTGSDAVYYLGIAADGYHEEAIRDGYHDWAFFPLFPIVVRAVSLVTLGDLAVAGVLASNLAFLAALLVLHALAVPYLGRERSIRALGLLALAPGAVAFAMAYSDSLYLLLAAGAFLAGERRRWGVAGILYGLASLTRLPGVLIGLPLAILLLQSSGWRPDRRLAWLAAGPAALAGFGAWQGRALGDPLAFLHAQGAWAIAPLVGGESAPAQLEVLPLLLVATLLAYTFLLVYLRPDRIPLPYAVLTILSLGTVVASLRLQSVARYLAVAWPFAWILAGRRGAWFVDAWPYLTAGLFALHAFLHFTQALAP